MDAQGQRPSRDKLEGAVTYMQPFCRHWDTCKGVLNDVCLLETDAFPGKASPGKDAAPHAKVQEGCADSWDLHFVLIKRPAQHAVQPPQVPPLHSAQKQ